MCACSRTYSDAENISLSRPFFIIFFYIARMCPSDDHLKIRKRKA